MAVKSGRENQDQEVTGGQEGQLEGKAQRAEEMLEDSQERPQQEEELKGAAGAEVEEGHSGGKMRWEWRGEEEGIKNMMLEIEIQGL